jgi:hypothetical protein|tara:strand:- start:85 stop:345 length:261 start_codon:yes stop_codon:yes gene_type:complete
VVGAALGAAQTDLWPLFHAAFWHFFEQYATALQRAHIESFTFVAGFPQFAQPPTLPGGRGFNCDFGLSNVSPWNVEPGSVVGSGDR